MKNGRNEKCSCGSGKKYKNCCMGSEGVGLGDDGFMDKIMNAEESVHAAVQGAVGVDLAVASGGEVGAGGNMDVVFD